LKSSFGTTATELEFVGNNPSSSAQIIYYLKKRHTLGKMDLEIQDEKATTCHYLQANKRNQRCNLGLQYENPKLLLENSIILLRHVQEAIIKW
jgi:hypothetical protein